jgi:hypothetical protein
MTQGFTRALTIPVPVTQGGTGLIATTTNQLLYSSGTNVIAGLATANNAILVTSAGGVPSWATTLPAFTTSSITFSPSTSGIVGTTTNNNASSGFVGEFFSAVEATGVALSTGVASNITSIVNLPAGDWDLIGNVYCQTAATTNTSYAYAWISTSSATFPSTNRVGIISYGAAGLVNVDTCPVPPGMRLSLAVATTVYLSVLPGFTISTLTGLGQLFARRVR